MHPVVDRAPDGDRDHNPSLALPGGYPGRR
jgi:hypothetical protein